MRQCERACGGEGVGTGAAGVLGCEGVGLRVCDCWEGVCMSVPPLDIAQVAKQPFYLRAMCQSPLQEGAWARVLKWPGPWG